MSIASTAPGDLDLLRRFVNSRDIEAGTDGFATGPALGAWLLESGLLGEGPPLEPGDRERAVAFREALRAVLEANHGKPAPPEALAALAAAAERSPVRVRFDPGGAVALEPARPGLEGALGRLLAIAARAEAEGTWSRLKVCPASDCRWAFYDRSRNRSRTWCTMDICGNRSKARAYRARTRSDT